MADSQGSVHVFRASATNRTRLGCAMGNPEIAAISESSSGDTAVVDVSARQAVRTGAVGRGFWSINPQRRGDCLMSVVGNVR